MNRQRSDKRSPLAVGMYWASRISTIGFEMAVPPLVGFWIDRQIGTLPWLTVIGACLGFLTAMMDVYRLSKMKFGPGGKSETGRSKQTHDSNDRSAR